MILILSAPDSTADLMAIFSNGSVAGLYGILSEMDTLTPFPVDASTPPNALCGATPLTIATLWRSEWSEPQRLVSNWLSQENFPPGSRFIWTYAGGSVSEQHLVRLQEFLATTDKGYHFTLVAVHEPPPRSLEEKHLLVSELYNDILAEVVTDMVLLVEDDNVAEPSGGTRLIAHFDRLPPSTGALMGAYRSRPNPSAVCAGSLHQSYLPWEDCVGSFAIEASWIGAGFSLYRTGYLQACLPATPIFARSGNRLAITGWDTVISSRLRSSGKRLFIDPTVRVLHACREVLNHCKLTLADVSE